MVSSADLRLKEREAVQAFSVGRSEDPFRGLFEALYPKLVATSRFEASIYKWPKELARMP
jgi:hypothetical protein